MCNSRILEHVEALTESNGFDTTDESLTKLRHRLFDVASELKPLATVEEISDRIRTVATELHRIEQELLLVMHGRHAEAGVFAELDDIDARLAAGWQPEGSDVDDVVSRLRSQI